MPSDLINVFDPNWGVGLLGDKAVSLIFDNTKIKRISPDFTGTISYERGAQEVINWFDEDPARQVVDEEFDQLTDRIIAAYERVFEEI